MKYESGKKIREVHYHLDRNSDSIVRTDQGTNRFASPHCHQTYPRADYYYVASELGGSL
jgi:hypothetical protein